METEETQDDTGTENTQAPKRLRKFLEQFGEEMQQILQTGAPEEEQDIQLEKLWNYLK